jgi:L-threonylcarbamoyladenylate synthase
MLTLAVDPTAPDAAAMARAAQAIVAGEVVAMPTDTLYGLAADPFNHDAVSRVFAVKQRPDDRAMPLVAEDVSQVFEWIGELPPLGFALATRFWPGPLTLVVRAPLTIDPRVTGETHTVGIRVPSHDVARALCRAAGRPLTATSANISGEPATADPAEVARSLGPHLAVLIDAGRCAGGPPSTLVDVTGVVPRLLREGAVPWSAVQTCLHQG